MRKTAWIAGAVAAAGLAMSTVPPAAADGVLCTVESSGAVVARVAEDGRELWRATFEREEGEPSGGA